MRKNPISVTAILRLMSGGFPLAFGVFVIAVGIFTLFNLATLFVPTKPAYAHWLEISEPFTEAVAKFVPAVNNATAFLQEHREFLEQRHRLYEIPAIRNVLAIDFALLLFLPFCFAVALWIDLTRNRERALNNLNKVEAYSNELGYPAVGDLILRLVLTLSLFFVPVYFGLFGAADPSLGLGFGRSVRYYLVVLGIDGIFIFITIYLLVAFVAKKVELRAQPERGISPDKSNQSGNLESAGETP
jgi:hypothetical protein